MTAREKKVRQEDKSAASGYFKKASDNYDQMLAAFHASNWNAAATLAVQCVISSADAICVYRRQVLVLCGFRRFLGFSGLKAGIDASAPKGILKRVQVD